MDRNQLRNIQGFLHPCYMISSSSWLILATVSAPLNLSIFQVDVSARIDWILIQDGVVRPFWRGLIRRPLAKEFSVVLMCRFSSALLTGSLLRHLVCSVDISVCFLLPFSISWPISLLREISTSSYPKRIPAVLSSFLSSQSSYQSVQSLPGQPSSNHPIYPIFKFLVPLFWLLFWAFPASHILANPS